MSSLRVSKIKFSSLAEGPRLNTTIWASGCTIRCPGCFNQELWDKNSGRNFSVKELSYMVRFGKSEGDKGVAFVGGEPMDQPWQLLVTVAAIKRASPDQVITIFSGYTLDKLVRHPLRLLVLFLADILVDGNFLASQESSKPNYRGSDNQRIIRLKPTRRSLFTQVVEANWENLIAMTENSISAPPTIAKLLRINEGGETNDCGKQ